MSNAACRKLLLLQNGGSYEITDPEAPNGHRWPQDECEP
jgi:hypothetical protein